MYTRPRINYCKKIIGTHQKKLERWAYSDGIVLLLDPIESANEQTQMQSLGALARRKPDRINALYADCVVPSCYNKAQGAPVRIWGVPAEGILYIEVLDESTVMNKEEVYKYRFVYIFVCLYSLFIIWISHPFLDIKVYEFPCNITSFLINCSTSFMNDIFISPYIYERKCMYTYVYISRFPHLTISYIIYFVICQSGN